MSTQLWGRGFLLRYMSAILAIVLALIFRLALSPVLGSERFPYATLFGAMVFCAWYCGIGPSIVALALSLGSVLFLFSKPHFTFRLEDPVQQIGGMLLFTLVSAFIVALGESNRRAQATLEIRIAQRTAELSMANQSLRAITARILHLQDEERRRLARELHDSVGQLLAAISMNLDSMRDAALPSPEQTKILDSRNLVEEVLRETRTISHLLHPPLLDELGLVSALKWYLDAFSTRSKIAVTLKAVERFPRLDNDSETAIFRVIQECLTNIHRHSGSEVASVELRNGPESVEVTVRDNGTGIPVDKISNPDALVGVGLGGMRQRLSQLGGTLEVHSDSKGTVVTATLPITKPPRMSNVPGSLAAAG